MKQRDIVLLPFPYSDLRKSKVRPALIISNDNINESSQDCMIVPLTSVLKDEPYSVNIIQKDFEGATLVKPSRVRVDKIIAVKKSLVIKKIATLSPHKFNMIKELISKLF